MIVLLVFLGFPPGFISLGFSFNAIYLGFPHHGFLAFVLNLFRFRPAPPRPAPPHPCLLLRPISPALPCSPRCAPPRPPTPTRPAPPHHTLPPPAGSPVPEQLHLYLRNGSLPPIPEVLRTVPDRPSPSYYLLATCRLLTAFHLQA